MLLYYQEEEKENVYFLIDKQIINYLLFAYIKSLLFFICSCWNISNWVLLLLLLLSWNDGMRKSKGFF